jgi:hypothetical protein
LPVPVSAGGKFVPERARTVVARLASHLHPLPYETDLCLSVSPSHSPVAAATAVGPSAVSVRAARDLAHALIHWVGRSPILTLFGPNSSDV